MRRVLRTGLVWALLWLTAGSIVGLVVGIVDPDSIDPGEEWLMLVVFGPMGFLSGVAFAFLLPVLRPRNDDSAPSLVRVLACGVLGSAIAQVPYLGHGDQGLLANIQMALVFCVVGGLISMMWLAVGRISAR